MSDRKDLLSELEVMKTLKPHPHVIKLLGCVTESGKVLTKLLSTLLRFIFKLVLCYVDVIGQICVLHRKKWPSVFLFALCSHFGRDKGQVRVCTNKTCKEIFSQLDITNLFQKSCLLCDLEDVV